MIYDRALRFLHGNLNVWLWLQAILIDDEEMQDIDVTGLNID